MKRERRELTIDDFIWATKDMCGHEYVEFMELSGPERIATVWEIFDKKVERVLSTTRN